MKRLIIFFLLIACIWACSPIKEQEKGSLVIGTEVEYPPFSFLDKEEIVGFDIDVIKEACKRANLSYEIKAISQFDALIPELVIQNIDLIASGMSPTEQRAKRVLFTTPHLQGNGFTVISKRPMENLHALSDLSGLTVAVNEGYSTEEHLKDINDLSLLTIATPIDAILATTAGHADVFILENAAAAPIKNSNLVKGLYVYTIDASSQDTAFALRKNDALLAEKINAALKTMKEDGTLQKMQQKWGLL